MSIAHSHAGSAVAGAGGRLSVNLGALVRNWKTLAAHAGRADCAAVVKANAYGCGTREVVAALARAGCRSFYVALPAEGVVARKAAPNASIGVLNGYFADAADTYVEHRLRPVLGSVEEIDGWRTLCERRANPLPCILHVDTGMNRLGLTVEEFHELADTDALAGIAITMLMTHFACADDLGHPKTLLQRERIAQCAERLPQVPVAAANSAGSLQNGEGSRFAFDQVRAGVAMYGAEALNDVANPMEPVVTLEGRVLRVRPVAAGDTVGYGAAQTMVRDSRIAIVCVGYADGYHRAASNAGVSMRALSAPAKAWFDGRSVPGVGRISMDLCAFDVTDLPETAIGPGDWIELFGPNIAIDDVARAAGTIGYELLTGLGQRFARTYIGC